MFPLMHQPWSGQTPSLSLLKIGRRSWRASEQWDSDQSMQRGHAGLQCVWGGVTFQSSPARPGALLPSHPPDTPSRSPCAHRQAGAGRCHWFPFAYFLVATTTHQKVHQYLYHQTSQTWWEEVCVTRAFRWAWRVAMLPCSWHGQAITHTQVSLHEATACQHTAGEISGSLHSKLLTLKCLHEVLLSTPPIRTWDGVYVKWVIISFNSLLLPWANISFHPQCCYQCLSFFSKHIWHLIIFSNSYQVSV